MALIFQPELVEELKARYKEALEDTYIQLDVARGLQPKPSQFRKHVFDFHDGIRLVISKEKSSIDHGSRLLIHYAGSVYKWNETEDEYEHPDINDIYLHHMVEHHALISDDNNDFQLRMIIKGKVAHFIRVLHN